MPDNCPLTAGTFGYKLSLCGNTSVLWKKGAERMASQAAHEAKADFCWQLANEYVREKREPFLCMNLIMYSIGHLIETLLAAQLKHPSSPPRGVPHGDREAQMRKHLVGKNVLPGAAADTYAELVA